ncbi:hypothetical protein, partial [Treponema sp.]|uniref:hypothetical protein n=1 Tax=Treponema sp. TaxID=166 RepID=UPI00298EC301
MKKINAFLIFFIFFFVSCENQFMTGGVTVNNGNGDAGSNAGNSKIVVSGKIELKGAVPQEILNSQSRDPADDGAGERTAMPVIPSGISYVITAKKGSDVVTADADSSGSFSLTLTEGSWDISAEGFVTSGGTAQRILKGSYTNSSTSNKYVVSNVSIPPLDIKVNPISSGEGKGDVYLTINLSGCDISSYRITWTESGILKTLSYNAGGTIASIPFCMIADGQTYAADRYKDVGSYEVLFEFFSDTSFSKKVLVYRDVINVFENLQTTKWINSGNAPFINSGGSFTVTPAILKTLQNRHDIYVRHGANGGTGSYYEPYGTLADAVTAINTCNDGDPYNIYLMSDYTASQDEISSNDSLINFNNSSSTPLNVVIRPYGASRRIIDANRTSTTGTVLYMSALSGADTSVTLKNVTLQGGHALSGGDQILVGSNSKLTLGSGAVVTGRTSGLSSIYTMYATSSIEINGDACVNSMDGICIQHNTSIMLGTDFAPAKDSNGNTIQTAVVSYVGSAAIGDKILSDNVS